jgi:hypothetical protein
LKACHKAKELKVWPSIYGDIAVTSLYAKDFDQAKRYLSKFLKTDVDPAVAFQIGRVFAFHDQALSAIGKAIVLFERPKVRGKFPGEAWTDEGARRPFYPRPYFLAVGGNTLFKRRYIAASA